MRLAIVASVIFGLGVIGGVSAAMTADLPKDETSTGTFTLSHGSGVIPALEVGTAESYHQIDINDATKLHGRVGSAEATSHDVLSQTQSLTCNVI
jgi:hypothetical protein